MKLEMRTDVCGLIQPCFYAWEISDEIKYYMQKDADEIAMRLGETRLNEYFEKTSLFCEADCAVTGVWRPREYNFQSEALEFEFEFPDGVVQRIVEAYYGDDEFFGTIKKQFGSSPGFTSFMPVEPKKFFAALTMAPNDKYKYDFERAISMVLWYEIQKEFDLDKELRDYMEDIIEACSMDGEIFCGEEDEREDES